RGKWRCGEKENIRGESRKFKKKVERVLRPSGKTDRRARRCLRRKNDLHIFSILFSSRRRHTRSLCDWSSDVCSSDLRVLVRRDQERLRERIREVHDLGR